jgi:hypothetical protein
VSSGPRTRGRALAAGLALVGLTTACLTGISFTRPADPAAAEGLPVAEVSDGTAVIAAAAAAGAGAAANDELADAAEQAVRAAAVVATTALPPVKAAVKPGTVVTIPRPQLPPWSGWVSGASGSEAEDGSFAAWRGAPLGVVAVWCDTSLEAQRDLDAVDKYAGFNGEMDVAVGALVRGETWEQAAAGAYVDRWTTAMRTLKAKRGGKGTTYVRIGHEYNGDWMAWGVSSKNLAAYKQGYRLYASIVRKEFPQAKLTWSPNGGNHTDISVEQQWPGDDVVDVIGPDMYDGYPSVTTQAIWDRELVRWLAPGSPQGLAAWQQFAAAKGKPLGLPEWGTQGGDHPLFIKGMHDFITRHAAAKGSQSVAGKFVYDCYFNAETKFKILNGSYPQAGQMYSSLTWGN